VEHKSFPIRERRTPVGAMIMSNRNTNISLRALIAITLVMVASPIASGQQGDFQNPPSLDLFFKSPRPVDVKPLTEEQTRADLLAKIDRQRQDLDRRLSDLNGYMRDDVNMKSYNMNAKNAAQQKSCALAIKANNQNARNTYIWNNYINPSCIDHLVYSQCYCWQGQLTKNPQWEKFTKHEQRTYSLIQEHKDNYRKYEHSKKEYDLSVKYREDRKNGYFKLSREFNDLKKQYENKYSH
jgi:hypothetical protein